MSTDDDVDLSQRHLLREAARTNKHLESIDRNLGKLYRLIWGVIVLPPLLIVLYAVWRARL